MVRTVFGVVLFCGVLFGHDVQSLPIGNEIETDKGIFLNPSLESGKRAASWTNTSKVNPEELGLYDEADIVYSKKGRNAIKDEATRWPKGEVPYEINGSFNDFELGKIILSMAAFGEQSCIRFRKRTSSDEDYVSIENELSGCWSSLGRIGGKQIVNLQSPVCTASVKTPIHQLMHTLGFEHEHNRYDRDDFVSIAFQNVVPGLEISFSKVVDESIMTTYGLEYDYRSIMHFSPYALSANGQRTIISKDPSKSAIIGDHHIDGFSELDKTRLRRMCSSLV